MNITLTREEAQQVLDALINAKGYIFHNVLDDKGNRYDTAIETLRARLSAPEPEYRDVVIAGDLWRIEFLPDHAASVVLVRANYEAQPEPEPVAKFVLADGLNKRVKLLVDDLPIGTLFYTAPSQHDDIYEEGCTPTDFRVLREANARMAQELFELRSKK